MALLSLTETMVTQLFPKIGQRSVFLKKLGELKDVKIWTSKEFFYFIYSKKRGECEKSIFC